MKKIVEFFVRNSLFGDLLTVLVIIIGFVSMFFIRREVFPNINFDVISISTLFPGASPEEVEKLVTNPLEQEIMEVDGIKKILSTSLEGRSGMAIFLDPDQTSAEKGKKEIEDAVKRVTDLPEETEEPVVTELNSKQTPIIEVALASSKMSPRELREMAKTLEREIEMIPGVARAVHKGLRNVEIRVEVSRQKLAKYRLSLEDVIRALKHQNLSIPGGSIKPMSTDETERIVRTIGDFSKIADIKKTVIRANDLGQSIKVRDVANVFYDLEKATYLYRTRGLPSVNLTILKKEKADAINVVRDLKKRLQELRPKFDPRLKLSFVNDLSEYIERRLNILTSNLGIGLFLVLLLLPLVIPFRFAMIIALGEPFAFLGALILLYYLGFSINLISLLGLIIVSGILVDDSIVVTENAVRLIEEEGMTPHYAAVTGTMQIMGPVTASVLTTSMSFLPMMFMTGIFGKFIREIPIAVLACLGVSLFETFFILPAHIAHWINPKKLGRKNKQLNLKPANPIRKALWGMRDKWDLKVIPLYLRFLRLSLRFRYLMALSVIGLFSGTILLAVKGMPFILFPPEGIEAFFIRVETPRGTALEQTSDYVHTIENLVEKLPAHELDTYSTSIGIQQQDPHDPNTKRGSEYAQIHVFLTPENNRVRTATEIIEYLRKEIGRPPHFRRIIFDRVNPGPPTGKPVSLGIRADNYHDILPAVEEIKKILQAWKGVHDITDSYTPGKDELQVNVKAEEAAAANLSVASIGNTVRASFEGLVATTVRGLKEKIDVRVSLPKEERTKVTSLEEIKIPNPMGNLIPITSVARVKRAQGLATYQHEDNQREVKVTADVNTNVTTATQVNDKIRELLPNLRKQHPNVHIDFGGEDEDTQESMRSLGRAFLMALVGIFLTLVLTFKQLLQPLIVLITIPLGIISVIWAFFFHGMPLSFMSMIGTIALGGVIVNNAIVFLDFVNQARKDGLDRMESIYQAAKIRLRPIFLTTITTVIGVLPTAYGIGGIDKFVVPIAMALGWGIFFGSILTAFVFPSALAILDDFTSFLDKTTARFKKTKTH